MKNNKMNVSMSIIKEMFKMFFCLVLFLMITNKGFAYNLTELKFDEWTQEDINWQLVSVSLRLFDAYQTDLAVQNGGYELNPFIKGYPSTKDIYTYFGTVILSEYLFVHLLPEKYRKYYQLFSIGISFNAIGSSYGTKLFFKY